MCMFCKCDTVTQSIVIKTVTLTKDQKATAEQI